MDRRLFLSFIVPVIAAALVSAQAQFSDAVRGFIKVDAPVVALTNVRVIDGTGAPARAEPDAHHPRRQHRRPSATAPRVDAARRRHDRRPGRQEASCPAS